MYNKIEKIERKCTVCLKPITVDQYGQGECQHCGWYNNEMGNEQPDTVISPNLIPLNKARRLVKEGLPFTPSFEDFIGAFNFYGEVRFDYNGKGYGVVRADDEDGIEFFESHTDNAQFFNNTEEFAAKANVNGVLLKDLWHEVKNPGYM